MSSTKLKWTLNNITKSDDTQIQNMSVDEMEKASNFLNYCLFASHLLFLPELARYLGLRRLYVKDESYRFGLNAFKVLGGSYAIARYMAQQQGYGTLAMEADQQLAEDGCRPTHIFIQAGVGSLAGAVVGYFTNRFKENPPVMVVVEANAADCLYRSAMQGDGSRVDVTGDMLTIMAGLACGEANTVSWDILRNHADAFVSCPDWVSANGSRIYAAPLRGDRQVISGESGSVTMGLVHALMTKPKYQELKDALKLNADSEVLLVSSEGDTDPERYHEITWEGLCGSDKEPFAEL